MIQNSSQGIIDQCAGNNLCHGVQVVSSSYAYISQCQWTGIVDTTNAARHYGDGISLVHSSVLHAVGNIIKNFTIGIYAHWNSDAHFNRYYRHGGNDGRTPTDIVNGQIENCKEGVSIWHNSTGYFRHLTIKNSRESAFSTGFGSSADASHSVTINGANIGFYCRHHATINANNAVVKKCTEYGFYAAYFGEIHAGGTRAHVSGNTNNYSPAKSHTLANNAGLIYIS